MLYAAPALAGAIVTFFMVKPVLARSNAAPRPLALEPSAEPVVFAFIEQICAQVGVPVPRHVQVDCQANASASLLPGLGSFLRRDLVLTIGRSRCGNWAACSHTSWVTSHRAEASG